MPTLLIITGSRSGARLPVLGDRFVIGRGSECDAVISEPTHAVPERKSNSISRKHAVLTFADGQWFIEDGDGHGRKSRNGTLVNDLRVPFPERRALQDQDRIRICNVRMVFHVEPESTFNAEVSLSREEHRRYLDAQPAEKLRVLLDVSTALRGTLDPDAVLERVLEHLFRLFPRAERGIVVVCESATGPLNLRTVRTPNGDTADQRFSTTVVLQCLEKLEAVLGNDLPTQFPESNSINALAVRTLMCAPLWGADGTAFGAVQLDTRADDQQFTPDDLNLMLGVASQASIALSNARLHRESLALHRRARDLELAHEVQKALLPAAVPNVPGYAFFPFYKAADEVGGDYYDFVPLPGGRLAVLLGDVSGHGVAAALVMARFGAEARASLGAEPDPGRAVARMNELVLKAAVPDTFVTLAAVVLDPAAHSVVVVSAGHPSPLVRRADGSVAELLPFDDAGLPLGVEARNYECRAAQLGQGESVLLFSDGVTEAMNPGDQQFGVEGVIAVFGATGPGPQPTVTALADAVRKHTAGGEQNDDITMVCFARTAAQPPTG